MIKYFIVLACTCMSTLCAHGVVSLCCDTISDDNFEDDSDPFLLNQVVVTSSKSELKRRNSPALVNVLNAKTFNMVNACSLADGLSFQPGVRVENDCQNCGFTQVRINGLDGHYSQILLNSRPVFSALTGVYGLEQIPATMIDRVEVMRGGGSALFGSSAVGGTINILTKDPTVNTATVSRSLMSIGLSNALDNNTTVNASVVTDKNNAGVFIYGQSRHRDGYDADDDGFTEVATLEGQTLGIRGYLRPSDKTRLTVDWHNTREYRRGGDNLNEPPHCAMVAEEVSHNIVGGDATLDIWDALRNNHIAVYTAAQSTNRKSYYGSEKDPNAYGRTTDLVVATGAQWTHNISRFLFLPAELIAGVEYNYNRLHDVTVGYNHDIQQNVNIFSGLLQNEWRNDTWGFLAGCRVDNHSMVDNPIFSPRANIRFNPSRNINLRLSFSTGFRSPQAYDEDFHVAIVGGERVVTVLAKGLKPESSRSVSTSSDLYTRFGNTQLNICLEGFYTDLSDVFALRELNQTDVMGNAVLERYNGSGARVIGMSLEGKVVFPIKMQVQTGLTWQQSRYKSHEVWSANPNVTAVQKMFRTPDLYGYLTVDYDIAKRLCVVVTGTLTGPMLVQHFEGSGTTADVAVKTPSFFDLGVKFSYEWTLLNSVKMQTSIGVANIFNSYQKDFDTGYRRDSGYIYGPSLPRSLTLSASLNI